MARQAAALGFTWLALEMDDFGNAARWPAFRDACIAAAIKPGVWFTNGQNVWQTPPDAGFLIAEVEGDPDRLGVEANLPRLSFRIPKAVISNFGGFIVKDANGVTDIPASMEKARKIREAGWTMIVEVYKFDDNGNPTGKTWESMSDIARKQLGFTSVQPAYGLFRGATLLDYDLTVPGWSAYLLEHIIG